MRAGKGSADADLADWAGSAARPCGDDLQAEASAEAARLESKFTDEDLERLVRSKGVDANRIVPDSGPAPASASACCTRSGYGPCATRAAGTRSLAASRPRGCGS